MALLPHPALQVGVNLPESPGHPKGGVAGPRAAYKVEVKFNANPEEVYSAVSLNAMLDIIHDDTLKAHHKHAMSCILATFKALGLNKAISPGAPPDSVSGKVAVGWGSLHLLLVRLQGFVLAFRQADPCDLQSHMSKRWGLS